MTRRYALWCMLCSGFAIGAWGLTTAGLRTGFVEEIWPLTLGLLPHIGWTGMLIIMAGKGPTLWLAGYLMKLGDAPEWLPWAFVAPATLLAMADALLNVSVWLRMWSLGLVRMF